MRIGIAGFIGIAVLLSTGGALLFATGEPKPARNGRVISATLSGHGPSQTESKKKGSTAKESKAAEKTDIWWTYCIATNSQSYFVLSRESPEKTGLIKNRWISFSEKKNQIVVVNPRGKNIALRILRKEKAK